MLQEASRLLQDGILEPIWTQHGPKLAPSWLKLGLCWPQVGSNLAQVGPMLAPDPGPQPQPPLSQPKPFQIPSQALQDPIKEATPHPPGLGSRIWSLGGAFWTSQSPNLDCSTWLQSTAQARWMGVASLYIDTYICFRCFFFGGVLYIKLIVNKGLPEVPLIHYPMN